MGLSELEERDIEVAVAKAVEKYRAEYAGPSREDLISSLQEIRDCALSLLQDVEMDDDGDGSNSQGIYLWRIRNLRRAINSASERLDP